MTSNPQFRKSLVLRGILSEDDAKALELKFKGDDMSILGYLVKSGRGRKNDMAKLWGDALGFSYVDLEKTLFQKELVQKMPQKVALRNRMIPIYQMGATATVAMADPKNILAIDEAEKAMGGISVSAVFALPDEVSDAIEVMYQTEGLLEELTSKVSADTLMTGEKEISAEKLKAISGDKSIRDICRSILLLAVKERASDIHIEPDEYNVRIRLRIDGILQERLMLGVKLLAPLISCLKIMGRLNIMENRRPQDGRISIDLASKSIDFRFSTIPTIYGEKGVLRVLGQTQKSNIPDLKELDFSAAAFKTVNSIIENPNGVFFVTGPTGSGKTTSLFSILNHLNKPGVNIMTIEDPVEYRLPGIYQVQVNKDINLDFQTALRAFLRQDPDVILIGEIRDSETAKIAAQAALTGHLVLATMHTNNALQAVTRLVEIGVEPFLVAPSIIGVMSQRLVRRICDYCKEKYIPGPEELKKNFICDGSEEAFFYRGNGCRECNHTGYAGRIGIHEIFLMKDEVREMISRNASIVEIKKHASRAGFKTMRYDGLKKVLRGLTTIDELERATAVDDV